MPTTRVIARQYTLSATAQMGIANLGTGNGVEFSIPANSILLRVGFLTTTAFNSATTTTVSAGDGTTTFIAAQDAKTVGFETVAVVGKYYPALAVITFSLAETGATATAGVGIPFIEYLRLDSQAENQF